MLNPDYSAFDYIYLSLGAGVQSTALYLLSSTEQRGVPRADVAIFADTQDEPAWVYWQLDRLCEWAEANAGVPIEIVSAGKLSDDLSTAGSVGPGLGPGAAIPAFTGGGMLARFCTRQYKIAPIEKHVREKMGFKFRQRIRRSAAACLVGISLDESQRIKDSRAGWVETCYPLIDARIHRAECLDIIADYGLPEPQKSSCVFCPYHSDAFWKDLRDNHPDEWGRACEIDGAIRNMSKAGVDLPVFLHRSLVPLADATLKHEGQGELFSMEHGHCDGFCDT